MTSHEPIVRPRPLTSPSTETDQVLEKDTVGFRSSGPSPTLHTIGLGSVGQAFLRRWVPSGCRLIGASDSTATAVCPSGFDPARVADRKRQEPVAKWQEAESIPTALAVQLVGADVVVDATASEPATAVADAARVGVALRGGAFVALAAKASLARAAHEWFAGDAPPSLGCNAALGGTGAKLVAQRTELRQRCAQVVAVPNATTTVVLEAIERGCSVAEGVERAAAAGLLEHDPSQDLDGTDAAIKGAIAGAILWGRRLEPQDRAAFDLRHIDPEPIRERVRRGATTRLVVRVTATGLRVGLEELAIGSPLAIPSDRVAYSYDLAGPSRVHVGLGVGPDGTAAALSEDVRLALRERAGEVTR